VRNLDVVTLVARLHTLQQGVKVCLLFLCCAH
jgi:hypothetical protein